MSWINCRVRSLGSVPVKARHKTRFLNCRRMKIYIALVVILGMLNMNAGIGFFIG